MHVHERWAMATTLLQIAIALSAITLLTRKRCWPESSEPPVWDCWLGSWATCICDREPAPPPLFSVRAGLRADRGFWLCRRIVPCRIRHRVLRGSGWCYSGTVTTHAGIDYLDPLWAGHGLEPVVLPTIGALRNLPEKAASCRLRPCRRRFLSLAPGPAARSSHLGGNPGAHRGRQ